MKRSEKVSMNKKVFDVLAYLRMTPQERFVEHNLRVVRQEGYFSLHHYREEHENNVFIEGMLTLTDLKEIGRLAAKLMPKKVLFVNISSLNYAGLLPEEDKNVFVNKQADDYGGEYVECISFIQNLQNINYQKPVAPEVF